jgi:hypothetical protein
MIKQSYYKKKVSTEKYVNVETGELLASEYNVTSLNIANEDLVIVSSEEYVIIDSKAIMYIEREFSTSEKAKIYQMINMVRGSYNLLYDNSTGKPHTKETLNEAIEYARNQFINFMKKLHEKSVIYYLVGYKNRRKCKWIMLNPTLARKQKTFHRDCLDVFTDLTKR